MKYKNVIFDLDGTITEPAQGITNAIIYALGKFGIEVMDRTSLYKFIGPPLRDSFREFYDFSEQEVSNAVAFYREYYSTKGILENSIMPGMEQALVKLKAAGCRLYVATSKPEIYAVQILEHLKLADSFDLIAGDLLDGSRGSKELVIQHLLDSSGISADICGIKNTVMVGDRRFDIIGAKGLGMDNIGVTFGYGDREELEACGAMYIADTAEEMADYILMEV